MKKILFIAIAAILVSCSIQDEPDITPPIGPDITPPVEPQQITFTLKNISEYNTFTYYIYECNTDNENTIPYAYTLSNGKSKTITLPDAYYLICCKKDLERPSTGIYKDQVYTEYCHKCNKIKNNSVISNIKGGLNFVNKTNDKLKVYINDGKYIEPFYIEANDIHVMDIDVGYYNIKIYEQDYILFQDKYEYDILLGDNFDQYEEPSEKIIWITE